jgi:acetyl-CoA synthetase
MSDTGSGVAVSIPTYDDFAAGFSAAAIEAQLAGRLDQGLNACIECCDQHAEPGRVALYWEGKDGRSARVSFLELKERSARLANLLHARGIRPGDRVAGLLPRIPELLVVILGVWRAGAVYQPLFTAFVPKAIEYRIASSEARLIFTDRDNRHKLAEVAECPPIIVVDGGTGAAEFGNESDFSQELAQQPATFEPVLMRGDDAFLMLFTSGTTGPAKGVTVPLKALLSFFVYTRWGLDLRAEDV